MDWFKVILIIAVILQEIQIISLRHEVIAISDIFFVASLPLAIAIEQSDSFNANT